MQLQFKGEEGVGSAKDLITIALLPPSSLPLSIYIYHQLANCSNLPSTVKMKTSRVRVHRNSVYYRNSRITSWRANEQSIVPPTPETRCPKNFASTESAARKQVRHREKVFDSGAFHFSSPRQNQEFYVSRGRGI